MKFCGIRQKFFQGRQIKGGRHNEDIQIRSEIFPNIQRKSKTEIGMNTAFVKFVKNDETGFRQFRIALKHPRQNGFGNDFNPRGSGTAAFRTGPVPHSLTDFFPEQLCHTRRRCPCGDPARLQHNDLFPILLQKCQRNNGTFPRTRLRRKQKCSGRIDCLNDLRQKRLHRQKRMFHQFHERIISTSCGRITPAFPVRITSETPLRLNEDGSRLTSITFAPRRFANTGM